MSEWVEATLDLQRDKVYRPPLLSGHMDGVKGVGVQARRWHIWYSFVLAPIGSGTGSWAPATPSLQGEGSLQPLGSMCELGV